MIKARFHANADDPRPIHWPVKYPYWVTGYAVDNSFAVIITYADDEKYILENWPEATNIETTQVEQYEFSERFPKPVWFDPPDFRRVK